MKKKMFFLSFLLVICGFISGCSSKCLRSMNNFQNAITSKDKRKACIILRKYFEEEYELLIKIERISIHFQRDTRRLTGIIKAEIEYKGRKCNVYIKGNTVYGCNPLIGVH